MSGMKVAIGGAGGDAYDTNTTSGDGDASFILSLEGQGARLGTFYAWVLGGSGNRISEIGGPVVINGKPNTDPTSCWAGWFFFTRN